MYKSKSADGWETSLATAFAVAEDGVLTTSCHVFDNKDEADAIVVMDRHRNVYPVREVLAANRKADTCLFRIDATDIQPLPLSDDAVPGTPVRMLGHPGDSFYYLSSGLVANYEKDHEGLVWLNITADFGQGASGGPVLDEYGNVVGQVSRTYTLYAGGAETRSRPRRVAAETPKDKREREMDPRNDPDADVADPQMVFKSCVPVKTLRALIQPRKAALTPKGVDAR
jgi:serine protease Do